MCPSSSPPAYPLKRFFALADFGRTYLRVDRPRFSQILFIRSPSVIPSPSSPFPASPPPPPLAALTPSAGHVLRGGGNSLARDTPGSSEKNAPMRRAPVRYLAVGSSAAPAFVVDRTSPSASAAATAAVLTRRGPH